MQMQVLHASSPNVQVNDSECNSLDLYVSPGKGHTVKAFAVFNGSILTGRIALVSSKLNANNLQMHP